jgi:23S rRNA (cytidine1920-2'-O)/16S rRNA (cytidine1409-2'-O)-methyltransferase
MRLDLFLVKHNFYPSRNKAQEAILKSLVKVNGKNITKLSYEVIDTDQVIKIQADEYVSRGAYKLLEALHYWNISLNDLVILDVGASTGGFTQVCLLNGAKLVYALDVGTSQLHPSLTNNPNIKSIEKTNFKDMNAGMFSVHVNLVVADISFISLTHLIEKISGTFDYHYSCIFLIKPEFELSPKEVKKGLVKDEKLHQKAIDKIVNYAKKMGFKVHGIIPSPILGSKKGNKEFLIYMEM